MKCLRGKGVTKRGRPGVRPDVEWSIAGRYSRVWHENGKCRRHRQTQTARSSHVDLVGGRLIFADGWMILPKDDTDGIFGTGIWVRFGSSSICNISPYLSIPAAKPIGFPVDAINQVIYGAHLRRMMRDVTHPGITRMAGHQSGVLKLFGVSTPGPQQGSI